VSLGTYGCQKSNFRVPKSDGTQLMLLHLASTTELSLANNFVMLPNKLGLGCHSESPVKPDKKHWCNFIKDK